MSVARAREAESTTMKDVEPMTRSTEEDPSGVPSAEQKVVARAEDEQVLPKNNLPLVFFSLLLATFLVRALEPDFILKCAPVDSCSFRQLWIRLCKIRHRCYFRVRIG